MAISETEVSGRKLWAFRLGPVDEDRTVSIPLYPNECAWSYRLPQSASPARSGEESSAVPAAVPSLWSVQRSPPELPPI